MAILVVKVIGIWIFLALLAIVNGVIRDKLLAPKIGQKVSLLLSGVSLSLLIFCVTLILVPFLNMSSAHGFLCVGIIWVLMTLAFEFLFGHYVVGEPWERIIEVFYLHRGNLYLLALVATLLSPCLAAKIRGLI